MLNYKDKVSGILKAKKSLAEQLLELGLAFRSRNEFKTGKTTFHVEETKQKEKWEVDPMKLTVKKMVARGTFGSVFLAEYQGRDVAVKVLEWGDDQILEPCDISILREAFLQEVEICETLDHPNIVKFIGAATDVPKKLFETNDGVADAQILPSNIGCIILEYIFGGTLTSYLLRHKERKLPFKIVHQLALDLAKGLSYLHSKKIVHRDIKPDNILLNKNHALKIADFGTAREEPPNSANMTCLAGTRTYMAPEVHSRKPYNKKCDVYSFGICLWQIYCCEIPCVPYRKTLSVFNKNRRPRIPSCCPKSMAKLMKKCWQKDPKKRPEMNEVVTILESIDTSKGGGMLPRDQQGIYSFLCRSKGP